MKAPGNRWMIFIGFSIAVAMLLAAYLSGSFTFTDLLDYIHHLKHPDH